MPKAEDFGLNLMNKLVSIAFMNGETTAVIILKENPDSYLCAFEGEQSAGPKIIIPKHAIAMLTLL